MTATTRTKDRSQEVAIGGRIRTLRMLRGMSQTDLGEALGLTFQQIQKYEKGTNRVAGSRLVQLATLLKTTPDELLTGKRVAGGTGAALDPSVASVINNADTFKVLVAMSQMDPAKRRAFAQAVVALAKVMI